MPTLAFWNIAKNVSTDAIAAFAHENSVDILVLAENHHAETEIIRNLNTDTDEYYFPDIINEARLSIFTRYFWNSQCLISSYPDVTIRHYELPLGLSILVVAVHLGSKLWKNTEAQILNTTKIARYIQEAEVKVGHTRTVVIGDFNMNPFEAGVVGAGGFHAVMDRQIAAKGSRKVDGEEYNYFYNPMWSKFGDADSTPCGTYYYNSSSEVNYFWNMFDQVLIRPSLLNYVETHAVQVVTKIREQSLLTAKGHPNRDTMSDHLPIICKLNEIWE
jgi:hypothetical protein